MNPVASKAAQRVLHRPRSAKDLCVASPGAESSGGGAGEDSPASVDADELGAASWAPVVSAARAMVVWSARAARPRRESIADAPFERSATRRFVARLAADASTRARDARTGARSRPGRARIIEVFLTTDAAAMTALRAREMVARDLATRGCVPSEVAWSVVPQQVGEVIVHFVFPRPSTISYKSRPGSLRVRARCGTREGRIPAGKYLSLA